MAFNEAKHSFRLFGALRFGLFRYRKAIQQEIWPECGNDGCGRKLYRYICGEVYFVALRF